jgi:antirestriction protein
MLRAFITNLGKYNEGDLVGKWIDLPISDKEFEKVLKEIGINEEYEEYFFTDYESEVGDLGLGEYESIEDLNELAESLEDIDTNAVEACTEYGMSVKEAIDAVNDGRVYFIGENTWNMDQTIGEYVINEVYGGEIPKDFLDESYIDYERLGRDIRLEYYQDDDMPETAGEYWCGDEDASDEDIGEAFVEEVGLEGVNHIEDYIDKERIGRDVRLNDGGFVTTDKGVWQIVED